MSYDDPARDTYVDQETGETVYLRRKVKYGKWREAKRVREQETAQVILAGSHLATLGSGRGPGRVWIAETTYCRHWDGLEHPSDGTKPCPLTDTELAALRSNGA